MKIFCLILGISLVLVLGASAQDRHTFRINSLPAGADVYVGSGYVGRTPLEYTAGHEDTLFVSLFYPSVSAWNAQVITDTLVSGMGSDISAVFKPSVSIQRDVSNGKNADIPKTQLLSEPKNGAMLWYSAGAGTAMLVSGGLAAYWKHQADRAYETYAQTGDRSYYDKTYTLDKRSTAALIATQISFGVLVYLLLNE